MPGFDSTGPGGQGPRTGRRMGRCRPRPGQDEDQSNTTLTNEGMEPGNDNFFGRGFGRGRGPGQRPNKFH